MTTLTQAVAIGDNQIYIDAALAAGQVPGYVKIDDELLNVGGQDNLAGTTLVLASPAQEAHDSGATVTYAGRPYDPTFKTALAGAGGEQTIRLLGPFRVSHDTPDLSEAGGTLIASLDPGVMVVALSCEVVEAWDDPADAQMLVGAGGAVNGNGAVNWYAMRSFLVGDPFYALDDETAAATYQVLGQDGEIPSAPSLVRFPYPETVRIKTAGGGIAVYVANSESAATGEADIYALIAEPAA